MSATITNAKDTKTKACYYCVNNKLPVDYKDVAALRRFQSLAMKIMPRRRSGLCAKHQRQVSRSIKHARQLALLPYMAK